MSSVLLGEELGSETARSGARGSIGGERPKSKGKIQDVKGNVLFSFHFPRLNSWYSKYRILTNRF
jgi:hypothetical protein